MESGGIIEFGVEMVDEDAGSIKDVEDVDIKLNVMKENAEDGDNNAAPEVGPATTGALEKKEMIKDMTPQTVMFCSLTWRMQG